MLVSGRICCLRRLRINEELKSPLSRELLGTVLEASLKVGS